MTTAADYRWVGDGEALGTLLGQMPSDGLIAMDTEADSMHHYREKLCLVQLSLESGNFLLDPLAGVNLLEFWKKMASCKWLLHGADYDLKMIGGAGAPLPENLFDTMIGAQLAGLKAVGYAALVEEFIGVKICKKNQKADWSKRPLPADMLHYAVEDTRYLGRIHGKLTEMLTAKGRLEWHRESCQRLLRVAKRPPEKPDREPWQISGHLKLTPKARAVLRALWEWREVEAEKLDRPTFKVLGNEQLISLSEAWGGKGGNLPAFVTGARRERLLAAIDAGRNASPIDYEKVKRAPKLEDGIEKKVEEIKKKRDGVAAALELDPTLIAPRAILLQLALEPESSARLIREDRWCCWQAELLK